MATVRPKSQRIIDRTAVPRLSPWIWQWFTWYARRYLAKQFHAVRILRAAPPVIDPAWPLVVYMNHPSWYDPLVGLCLARTYFPDRTHFAPIDAQALTKYPFLGRIGFYGLDRGARSGAVRFLRTSEAIAAQQCTAIWLTPQGEFTDVRERPVRFQAGLGHLVERLPRVALLPLAIEYVYWNESRAEVLLALGTPQLVAADHANEAVSAATWTTQLADRLEELQNRLAAAAVRRDPTEFDALVEGKAGVGGVYDLWRRGKALWRGERFRPEHGAAPP